MARTLMAPMLLALGLGACALENPAVRVGPGSTLDASIDLGVTPDVGAPLDQPIPPMDLGSDAGAIDTGIVDAGVIDTGVVDTGVIDTGPLDTGPLDTGPLDTGPVDTGPLDTGPRDTGPVDTGPLDTGPADTGPIDTGPVDTGVVDAGSQDVIVPRDVGGTDVPVTTTCGANGQECCTGPMRCNTNLLCQRQFGGGERCVPCGAYFQLCCSGSCREGVCRIGFCSVL
nr:hypothetical protein [Deltaproteobacteria bacterium]